MKKKIKIFDTILRLLGMPPKDITDIDNRESIHKYFMDIADKVAERATCDRRHVGAVIVRDKRILATGYNGSLPGTAHCDDIGHLIINGHCHRTVHAELNAIAQCALCGISCQDSNIYINTYPCLNCFKSIIASGIRVIYYKSDYESQDKDVIEELLKDMPWVELVKI